jgi:hypothetical protein
MNRLFFILFFFYIHDTIAQLPSVIDQNDSLVNVCYSKGDFKNAVRYSEESIAYIVANALGDSVWGAKLMDLAYMQEELGLLDKAEENYWKAAKIYATVFGEQHEEYSGALNNIGGFYHASGDYAQARRLYDQAIKIRKQKLGVDNPTTLRSMSNLAVLLGQMNAYTASNHIYQEIVRAYSRIGQTNTTGYGRLLNNIAYNYANQGRTEEALDFFLQTKQIYESTIGANHPAIIDIYNNIATMYRALKQYDKAIPLVEKVLAYRIRTVGKQHILYGKALSLLALIHADNKDYKKAIELLKEVRDVRVVVLGVNHIQYWKTVGQLGYIHTKINEYDTAEKYLSELLESEFFRDKKDYSTYLSANNRRAVLAKHRGVYSLAITYYEKAIQCNIRDTNFVVRNIEELITKDPANLQDLLASLKGLNRIYAAEYKTTPKLELLQQQQAVNTVILKLVNRYRTSFRKEKDKKRLLEETIGLIEPAMGIDYHLYQNIKDEQSLEKAFQKAEQNKSILLKDAIKGERGYTLANIPDSLFVKQQQLQKQLATVQRKKIQANTTEQKRGLQASENEILLSIEDFKTSLLQEYPEYHALQYDQKEVSLSTIQEDLKEEDLLIEYLVGDYMTYVFGITREKTTMVALNVSRKTLHYRTKLLRQSLSNYQFLVNDKKKAYAQYTEQAHWFYTNFLAKLLEQIEEDKKHLILVTDDELGHLPFETFLTTSGEQQAYEKLPYLVNQYSISYIYSAMLWQENNRIDASLNNHQLLGLASSYEALDTMRLDSLRSETIAEIRELLEPLSAVSEEVAALEQQFEGQFLAGQQVTEQFF